MATRAYTEEQVRKLLRDRQGERTQRQLAKEIGIPETNLSQILKGRIGPGPTVLRFLGLEVAFVKVDEKAA